MSLAQMFACGPTIKAKKQKTKPLRPINVIADWKETYRCIGIGERTAAEILVKISRARKLGLPLVRVSTVIRRLRKMEALGFVSQRAIFIETSTKPVMTWKRVKPPCQ